MCQSPPLSWGRWRRQGQRGRWRASGSGSECCWWAHWCRWSWFCRSPGTWCHRPGGQRRDSRDMWRTQQVLDGDHSHICDQMFIILFEVYSRMFIYAFKPVHTETISWGLLRDPPDPDLPRPRHQDSGCQCMCLIMHTMHILYDLNFKCGFITSCSQLVGFWI